MYEEKCLHPVKTCDMLLFELVTDGFSLESLRLTKRRRCRGYDDVMKADFQMQNIRGSYDNCLSLRQKDRAYHNICMFYSLEADILSVSFFRTIFHVLVVQNFMLCDSGQRHVRAAV